MCAQRVACRRLRLREAVFEGGSGSKNMSCNKIRLKAGRVTFKPVGICQNAGHPAFWQMRASTIIEFQYFLLYHQPTSVKVIRLKFQLKEH